MSIDIHTHLDRGRFDPRILAQGERLGIERFACSNIGDFVHQPDPDDVHEMNRVLAGEMRAYPGRVLGYCYVNPRGGARSLDDVRRRIEDDGMIGLKFWVATLADDPLVDPFLEYAAQRRLLVLMHAQRKATGQLAHESTADHVAAVAARHPDARFLMAHLGGQPETAIETVRSLSNVAVDTSGTIIDAGGVALAVERLGAERVAFGSDMPHSCLARSVGEVLGAYLPPADLAHVLGGNASRWIAEVQS